MIACDDESPIRVRYRPGGGLVEFDRKAASASTNQRRRYYGNSEWEAEYHRVHDDVPTLLAPFSSARRTSSSRKHTVTVTRDDLFFATRETNDGSPDNQCSRASSNKRQRRIPNGNIDKMSYVTRERMEDREATMVSVMNDTIYDDAESRSSSTPIGSMVRRPSLHEYHYHHDNIKQEKGCVPVLINPPDIRRLSFPLHNHRHPLFHHRRHHRRHHRHHQQHQQKQHKYQQQQQHVLSVFQSARDGHY